MPAYPAATGLSSGCCDSLRGENAIVENVTHRGGCHCGAVHFEFDAPADIVAHQCNCSMCDKVGFEHIIVPASRFRLTGGADALTEYRFNTGTARHLFCRICGVKSFYVPRSNPDGFSVNLRCVDQSTVRCVTREPFDGRNWEQNAGSLADLSKDD
ncbi:MAG: GFA family protein [Gammaproteobacteria bacterium]|nr:GFA family protein [Gammaproteobacteria bacterium]